MVSCGAAKEVVLWALTRDQRSSSADAGLDDESGSAAKAGEGAQVPVVLPEFLAGHRLVGTSTQLLSIDDATAPSSRLEPASGTAASEVVKSGTDEDAVEIADQRITCADLVPVALSPTAGGAAAAQAAIGFAACTSGQLMVFQCGPFSGTPPQEYPGLALLCSVDLGQPLLSAKALRTAATASGKEFIVLCGGTSGVLFVLRVAILEPGSEASVGAALGASVHLLGSVQAHDAGVNALDARLEGRAEDGTTSSFQVITAGDDECLCRLQLSMAAKSHRY